MVRTDNASLRRLAKIIYPIVCLEPLGNPGFLSHRRIGYCGEPPKFGGSFIRQRITPLNGGRSRQLRRRLVAVPTCCRRSGATRVIDAGDQGSGNAARVFSAIREVSHGVTGTEARTQTAEGWEPTSAPVSRTALAPPPI